jgi:hypothetical protein
VTLSSAMPASSSVRPHGTTPLPLDGFSWISIFTHFFRKCVEIVSVSLKFDKNKGHFTWISMYICDISRWILLRMESVADRILQRNENHAHNQYMSSISPTLTCIVIGVNLSYIYKSSLPNNIFFGGEGRGEERPVVYFNIKKRVYI